MADVMDPPAKKPKLSSPSEYEDETLAQLEKMEPLPSSQSQASGTGSSIDSSQQPSSVHMPLSNGPSSMNAGSVSASSTAVGFSGPGSQSQSSGPSQAHCASNQQNQPSVLQELLLNPSNPSVQAVNSPRPAYSTPFQTRSPLTSAASMISPANCPQSMTVSGGPTGPRGLRAAGPQMFNPAGHPDMGQLQSVNATQINHNQQNSYQLMAHGTQQPPHSIPFGYQQQQQQQQPLPGSRPVYGSNMRGNTPQSTGMSRGGGSIMMNGAGNPPPRMRGTHPGKVPSCRQMTVPRVYPNMVTMQPGSGGQIMRNMIVHNPQFEQSTYVLPIASGNVSRAQDPYGMQQTQQGQQQSMSSPGYVHLSSGHINARNQSIAFSNQSSGQPGIQSQANIMSHMVDHQMIPQPQAQSTQGLGNVMQPVNTGSSNSMNAPPNALNTSSAPMAASSKSLLTGVPTQMPVSSSASNLTSQQFSAMGNPPSRDGSNPGSNLPPSGQGGQDPEKRKLIQQQLVLLLHAHKCQQRERSGGDNGRSACTLPHCSTMKEVLTHMTSCSSGRSCTYAHCASSRQIISHWKNCVREDCPVCKPLKNIQNTSGADRRPVVNQVPGDNFVPGSLPAHSSVNATSVDPNISSNRSQVTSSTSSLQPPSSNSNAGFGSPMPPTTSSLLVDYNPPRSECDPFRSPNPPNKILSGKNTDADAIRSLPPPDAPAVGKEWHASVTRDLRNHLVGKLVRAIFPAPDPHAMADQRIRDLICYARKVEKDMFEMANDREEYYHLLAEKIYKIQKELQEKKHKRMSDQNMLSATQTSQLSMLDLDNVAPPNRNAYQMNVLNSSGQLNTTLSAISNISANGNHSVTGTKTETIELPQSSTNTSVELDDGCSGGCSSKPGSSNSIPGKIQSFSIKNETIPVKMEQHMEIPDSKSDLPEKVFDANELRSYLKPILERIHKMDESIPFRIPVDPVILEIPDYFDIVKKPMDLQTIGTKLDTGLYNNPREFCDDMWLMFENAWTYNRKNSKVYKFSTKLSEFFAEEINPVMQKMGYCCGNKLSFTPLALFCYGQSMCTIARDQPYMVYENSTSQFNVVVNERYTYCLKCFESLPEAGINLSDNPNDTANMVPKSKFKLMKNDQIDHEPLEKCKFCYRNIHRICAIYNKLVFPDGFICDACRKERNLTAPENRFTAKKLPHCNLSKFVEERVNKFLRSNPMGKDLEVIIRVLCATDKEVEVKTLMKAKYGALGFPEKFPYRSKAIFAFEVIDGVEVCFFGLHVQEYGSNCPAPNQRRVYIAYLDSVNFFQPRAIRTDVYHEILLGYLQYAMLMGYTMAHIWACPPSEGDDYIFHCHPPDMKIPKPKRLQDWYKKLLEKGIAENIVFCFKDIYRQARDDNLLTPMALPYFEGDFWPNVIEDCIREVENEEQERKRQEELQQNGEDDDEHDAFGSTDGGKSSKKNIKRKNNLKKNMKSKKKICSITGDEVTDKLYSNFDKHKEVFFTIRLMSPQSELTAQNSEIKDPDGIYNCDLMDGRDTFLTRARDEHWEFSSLRRAKYSTMCFCQALHTQDKSQGLSYTCNKCQKAAHWHCNTCEDFDLCNQCYQLSRHEHDLEKVSVLVEVNEDRPNSSAGRLESIQRCIQSLVHACQCRDANCRRPSCKNMKRVVMHARSCRKRSSATCPICKQLIALCCYHAKHCDGNACSVPFCSNIRKKLQDQKRSMTRRADMLMRRRMDMLQAGSSASTTNSVTSTQNQTYVVGNKPAIGQGNMVHMQAQGSALGHMSGSLQSVPIVSPQTLMPIGQSQQHVGQVQQVHSQQYASHGKDLKSNFFVGQPGSTIPGNVSIINASTGVHQSHGKGQNHQQGSQSHQQNVRLHMASQISGMQRQSINPQSQQSAPQTLNPPPYIRAGPQQGGYGISGPSPSTPYGGTGQSMIINQTSIQQGPQLQQMMHQQGVRQKIYAGQVLESNRSVTQPHEQHQLQIILERLKNARTPEEKEQVFGDLKKMPHLFAAFIKMKGNGDLSQVQSGQGIVQQQMGTVQQSGQGMTQHNMQQQHSMMRQSQLVNQQGNQWQQQSTISPQTQQFYQQQTNNPQSGQTQQQRGATSQYPLISQSQVSNASTGQAQPQWQQQFQRNPVSPAMQQQFSQVRSPTINRSPSVSGLTPSPMMHPSGTTIQQMQQQLPPQGPQEQQNYR